MPYAEAADVEIYLNTPFVGDQEDAATALVAAASAYVDRYTGRTWVAATVTGEVRTAYDGLVRLTRAPVASVSSVSVRGAYLGAASSVLVAGTGYELLDATRGLLAVDAYDGQLATVTYVTAPTVPDDIKQAAVILAASWLSPGLNAQGRTFSKIKAGSAELVYRDTDLPLPPAAAAILDGYRAGLVFA